MWRNLTAPKRTFALAAMGVALLLGSRGSVQAALVDLTLAEFQAAPYKSTKGSRPGDLKLAQRARGARRIRRRPVRRRRVGVGTAVGAAILTGIILSEAARARRRARFGRVEIYANDVDVQNCIADYRSFRLSDGTYQPLGGGPRRLCPHLLN